MAADGETEAEDEMLPDERAVISERASHLSDVDDDAYFSVEEAAERLGIELE